LATVAHIFSAIFVPQVHLALLRGGRGFLFSFFFYLCAGGFAL